MSQQIKSRFVKQCPYDRAGFLSRVCFAYLIPLMAKATKNDGLLPDDLYQCAVEDEAENVMQPLVVNWEADRCQKKVNFGWTLLRTFWARYILPFSVFAFEELFLQIAQPLLLSRVIRYFSADHSDITYLNACLSALGVCTCGLVFCLMDHPTLLQLMKLGMQVRTACCALMYQKTLRLSRASVGQTQVGQIINIMSNDVARIDDFTIASMYLLIAPIQSAIIVYIVWTYLGPACLAGVAILLLYIPFQGAMGKLFANIRSGVATLTDTRLRYMNEIISGIRVIKMYCWEAPFAEKIANARRSEVSKLRQSCYLKAVNLSTYFVASRLILFVCFVVYVALGNTLKAEAVFVSMALFNTLRMNMTLLFPNAVSQLAELKITCQRIQKFLLLEEISDYKTIQQSSNEILDIKNSCDSACLNVEQITAKWNLDDKLSTLMDISVQLKPGELLAVIGPVGAGKSSFLMSLLNELPLQLGKIDLQGSISYSSQDSWSFNNSVRNNILFGSEYDEQRYRKVVSVCALERDFELMPLGDRSLVGERGVSLSGGQKARINLARAVYRDADICLLDDPLSAVDASVAMHIFDKCIMEHLSAKIRVLVTHQIQFIEKATKILVLKEGKCIAYGNYREVQESGIDFVNLLKEEDENEDKDKELSDEKEHEHGVCERKRTISEKSAIGSILEKSNEEGVEVEDQNIEQIEEEQSQRGAIKGAIYWEYIRAGAGRFYLLLLIMVSFTIISQSLYHGSDLFLTYWTNQNQETNEDNIKSNNNTRDIIIYSVLIASLFVTTIVRSISFFIICMRASVVLHNTIFGRLLRAPVTLFDSSPAGRILNRFSQDLGNIDEKVPYVAYDFILIFCQAIGVFITIAIANWVLLIPSAVLTFIILVLRQIYLKAARDIKRYESLSRSPVFSHVSTTINGLASIRAFGEEASFVRQFYVYQNDQTSMWFLFFSTSRLAGYFIDLCCTAFIFSIAAVVMLSTGMEGGTAGLIFSSGLMLAGSTQYGVRMSAEFESQMTSVERVVEYKHLEQEAPSESMGDVKPKSGEWPKEGQIEFDQMSLCYGANLDKPVLKNIDCIINGGEKIGIVGRTGAGKSSLIVALFRLTEPSGAIRIDGVDIQSIGLDDLRKNISIIPQDPVVFTGTVRYNLDPFNEYPDSELWTALDKVQLKQQVDNFDGKLDAKLSDSGANLSVGQRQLVCLARAILRRNQILILDEATANVDHQTDSLIQKTIRSEFAACTVLTIAHRLNTIIDCDRVLVLDAGQIVEFDTPYKLLNKRDTFYEMCQKTGNAMYSYLFQVAANL